MPCTGHDHDHDEEDELGVSLQSHINMSQVYCLNEHQPNAGKSILKPYVDRHTLEPSLQSPRDDDDVELLIHVPFSEAVSMKTISISGRASVYLPNGIENTDDATSAPSTVKIFANRIDLDFDTARDLDADVELTLLPPEHAVEVHNYREETIGGNTNRNVSLDYPLRGSKFKFCTSVTLFFGDNYAQRMTEAEGINDDDNKIPTEITYVGFKGAGTSVKRQAVKCVYESRGMKKDHKVPDGEFGTKESKMY